MRVLFAVVLAATLAVPAAADDLVTVRVDLAEIDLSAPDARERLVRKIDAVAQDACTVETRARYRFNRDRIDRSCFVEARAAALAEAEQIIAVRARSGRTVAAK